MNSRALPHRKPAGDSSSLAVRNLKKRYGSRTVVKDVSLDVKSGEVVGLLGPNGAGKTTSFYMIVGLVPLDAGEIALDGNSISLLPIHKRATLGLSYLPQEASVFRKLTVEQNIRAVLELQTNDNGKRLQQGRHHEPHRSAARRTADRALARKPGAVAVGRRAPPGRNRPRAGHQSEPSSCSTNRSRASIRSPCWKSRRSLNF